MGKEVTQTDIERAHDFRVEHIPGIATLQTGGGWTLDGDGQFVWAAPSEAAETVASATNTALQAVHELEEAAEGARLSELVVYEQVLGVQGVAAQQLRAA